jgi:hypothetical protein
MTINILKDARRFALLGAAAGLLSSSAFAQIMYKCEQPNFVGYGFASRDKFDCKVLTMAEVYKEKVVPKELHLVCHGKDQDSIPKTETYHFLEGRGNRQLCFWTERAIVCPDISVGLSKGYVPDKYPGPQFSVDRFSGAVSQTWVTPGTMATFDGSCSVATSPKF